MDGVEQRERETASSHLLGVFFQMPAVARTGPAPRQEPETTMGDGNLIT